MDWLLVGTGPSVTETLPGLDLTAFDGIATCNAGIAIVPVPTVYMACDRHASRSWHDEAMHAQRHGTHLVTLQRDAASRVDRMTENYDEYLTLGERPTRTEYGPFRYSGPLLLEYILRRATSVAIVGVDGYQSGDERDYWQPQSIVRKPAASAARRTIIMGKAFMERATLWPDVPIVQYGFPRFGVTAANWRIECQLW